MATNEGLKNLTKLASALIVGGATVLAAMLPLYFSSQRELKQTTRESESESAALRRELADIESRLQQAVKARSEAERRLSVAGLLKPTGHTVIDHDFQFELKTCKLADALECDFLITNLLGDRELSLSDARMIDDAGNEYPARFFALGAQSGSFARMVLPGAVPIKASVRFPSVRPATDKIAVLELTGYNWPASGGRDTIVAKFQRISL